MKAAYSQVKTIHRFNSSSQGLGCTTYTGCPWSQEFKNAVQIAHKHGRGSEGGLGNPGGLPGGGMSTGPRPHPASRTRRCALRVNLLAHLALLLPGRTAMGSQLEEPLGSPPIEGRQGVDPFAKLPALFPSPGDHQPPSVTGSLNSQEVAAARGSSWHVALILSRIPRRHLQSLPFILIPGVAGGWLFLGVSRVPENRGKDTLTHQSLRKP